MIRLTRLDGDVLLVNPQSIRTVARLGPNSSLRFGDGTTVVVAESPDDIAVQVMGWERDVRLAAPPPPPPPSPLPGAARGDQPDGAGLLHPDRHLRLVR